MKGMSTVVATILMLAITIALAGTAYLYISGYITGRISTSFSIIDSYQSSVTIMNDGSSTITSFSSVKVDGNDAVYRVSTQDDSITGYYKFGDASGTTAGDSSGKGNIGTIYGATPVDGYFGKALSFDGNDYVDIADSGLYFSDAVTEDKWTNTDDILKYGKVLSLDSVANSNTDSFSNGNTYSNYIRFPDVDGDANILDGSIKRISFDGIDPTLEINVSASADDAVHGDNYGSNSISGTSITMYAFTSTGSSSYNRGGFRFTNVAIPQGAKINVAYISFNVVNYDDPNFAIYAEAVNSSADFTSGVIGSRLRTIAYTDWIANNIGFGWKNSPSIVGAVQEVINRPGWVSNNALNILVIPYTNNSNRLSATSWEGNPVNAAKLYIEYNGAPTISSVVDSPDPVAVGGQTTYTVNWSDPNSGDLTRIHLCRTNGITGQTCDGGNWCETASFSATPPTSCSYTIQAADTGTQNYYAFVCDDDNDCSAGTAGTFTVQSAGDTTPPTRSNGQPSGTLPAGTTSTNINLTATDSTPPVSCRYSTTPNTLYSSMTNTLSNIGGNTYSATVAGLTNGNTYYYYVRCQDSAAIPNANPNDFNISFSVALPGDTTPPSASISINSGASTTASTSVTLTLSCSDASGVNAVRYSNDGVFDTELFEPFASTRAWNLTSGDGTKTAWYQCRDNSTNQNTVIVNDTIILDTTAPVRSNGQPNVTLPSGTTQTNINLTTNEVATCRYSTTAGIAYGAMINTFNTTGSTFHSQLITGLTNGNNYNYYVKCNDTVGNLNPNDFNISFSVALPGDTTPPTRSNGQPTGTLPVGTTSTNINLTATDSTPPVSCRYSTTPGTAYSSMTNTLSNIGGNIYSATVAGLTNGNTYYYYVRCQDSAAIPNANPNDFPISFSVASSGGFQPSNHTAITVDAWINPAGTGTRYILANPYLNTQNSKYAIYVASNGTLGVAQTSNLGSWSEVRGGINSVPNGFWTHVAYTWDAASGLARYYINGNLVGSRADTGTVLGVGGDIRMGSHAYISNGYFNGIIDEVRIYNRSLSEGEIKANFDIGSQITSGQLATIEIYNNLTAGTHTFRICTSSMCNTAYLTIV